MKTIVSVKDATKNYQLGDVRAQGLAVSWVKISPNGLRAAATR